MLAKICPGGRRSRSGICLGDVVGVGRARWEKDDQKPKERQTAGHLFFFCFCLVIFQRFFFFFLSYGTFLRFLFVFFSGFYVVLVIYIYIYIYVICLCLPFLTCLNTSKTTMPTLNETYYTNMGWDVG